MPMKPCKYGIKLMCMTDSRNSYLINAYIYAGKNSDAMNLNDQDKQFSKPTQAVLSLITPIINTNRNITADNWFTSIELVELLKEKKLTYVGTIKKNKREIPPSFLPQKKKEVGKIEYGFTKHITMVSMVTKPGKSVILVSSMHHQKCFDEENNKPEIISYYNLTKGGVDSLDQKCSVYSSSRRSQRWPLTIFYRMLDIASVNAFVLYNSYKNNIKINRAEFLKKLAFALVEPEMERRYENKRIPRVLRLKIGEILNKKKRFVRNKCFRQTAQIKKKRVKFVHRK